MNIELPADAAQFVQNLVARGEFPSPSDAVVEGVRLLMDRQQLREQIQLGINQLDAGEGIDGEEVFRELRERAQELARPKN